MTCVAISRDGRILSTATADGRVAVFRLAIFEQGSSESSNGSALSVNAMQLQEFAPDARVTAMSIAHVPAPSEARAYSRFRENGYCVITGHVNGFLNVWWLGNNKSALAPGPLDVRNAPRARRGAPPPPPPAPPAPLEPMASYPPFHASRGPITHISAAFVVEEVPAGAESLPRLFSTAPPGAAVATRFASTAMCVGASGAMGWRVFSFAHESPVTRSSPSNPPLCLRADDAAGAWGYDADGRRTFAPPPPVDVSHLTIPAFSAPSFADVLRAPIVGAPPGEAWASATGGVVSSRPGGGASGCEPRGTALLQLLPSADADIVGSAALMGSVGDAGADTRALFWGLGEEPVAGSRSLFRALARAGAGASAAGAGGTQAHAAYPGAPSFGNELSRDASSGGRSGGGYPNEPFGRFAMVPRAVVLLYSERGVHAAGFDHHAGVIIGVRPETMASHVASSDAAAAAVPPPPPPPPQPRADAPADTWSCGAGALQAKPSIRRTPPPLNRGAALTAKLNNARSLLRARTSYVPPPETLTHSKRESPPSAPVFPMSKTGRQDAILHGLRQVFHEEDASQAAALSASEKQERAKVVALAATINRALRPRTASAPRSTMTQAAADSAAAVAREEKEAERERVRLAASAHYMPRHSAARLLYRNTPSPSATQDDLAALLAHVALYSVEPKWEQVAPDDAAFGGNFDIWAEEPAPGAFIEAD